MSAVSFKVAGAPAVEVPAGDAAQLGLHLAVFGPDEEMPRSRSLAEKIAVAISMAEGGATALLPLTDSQKADVSVDVYRAPPQTLKETRARWNQTIFVIPPGTRARRSPRCSA